MCTNFSQTSFALSGDELSDRSKNATDEANLKFWAQYE